MTVHELAELRRAGGEDLIVLDVREPEELAFARLDGAVHIPMRQIPARLPEIDRDRRVVVMCHHGMRSAQVAGFLREQGFARVENLDGGIDAWSAMIDPSVPRY